MDIIPSLMCCLTNSCLKLMCLDLSRLAIIDFTICSRHSGFTIAVQGDWRHWFYNSISNNKFFSHFASLPATAKAINSAFMVECEMQVCFLEAHLMVAPPRVKIQPEVDLYIISSTCNPTCIYDTF